MVRDARTLATKDQFVASLPARATDTVHYRTSDGSVVVARVTHSIELIRTYQPEHDPPDAESVKMEVGRSHVFHELPNGKLEDCPRHRGAKCAECDRQALEAPAFTMTIKADPSSRSD